MRGDPAQKEYYELESLFIFKFLHETVHGKHHILPGISALQERRNTEHGIVKQFEVT